MSVKKEWTFFDTGGNSQQSEVHPGNGLYSSGVRLVYCYYHKGDTIEYLPDLGVFQDNQRETDFKNFVADYCKRNPC